MKKPEKVGGNVIETIEIDFPAEMENKIWKKRVPHKIQNNDELVKEKVINKSKSEKNEELDYSERVEELRKSKNINLHDIEKLQESIRVNFERCNPQKANVWLKELEGIRLENQNENSVNMSVAKTVKKYNVLNDIKSQKGFEVEQKLNQLKVQVKNLQMTEKERDELLAVLKSLQKDIETNMSTFTGIDNIQGRLNQIEQYREKLSKIRFNQSVKKTEMFTRESKKHKMKVIWKFGL